MMPGNMVEVARSLNVRTPTGRAEAELHTYLRTEYNGDGVGVLAANTRAGRGKPAVRLASPAERVSRAIAGLARALAAALTQPSGS